MTPTPTPGRELLDGPRLHFPGTWWQIPLADNDAARDSARRLIVESIGRADQHARLRAELRRRLESAITEARAANARRFAIAIEIVPDIPIPAFLSVFDPGTDLDSARSAAAGDVMDILVRGFERASPATDAAPLSAPTMTSEKFQRFAVGDSQVVRRVRYRVIPADGDIPEVTNLIVEFWMTVPGRKRVVLLSFASPAAALADPLQNLFGAIVASAEWNDSPPEP